MKAQSHREWYRSLGRDIFPLAFRNAPPWVFERMGSTRPNRASVLARICTRAHKAFLLSVAGGHSELNVRRGSFPGRRQFTAR